MEIILNNNPESFREENLTIQEIIDKKGYTFKMLVTRLNGALIKKNERESTIVKEGDDLMVLHLMSGG